MNRKLVNNNNNAKLIKVFLSIMCLLKYLKKGMKFNPYIQSVITLILLYEYISDMKLIKKTNESPLEIVILENELT